MKTRFVVAGHAFCLALAAVAAGQSDARMQGERIDLENVPTMRVDLNHGIIGEAPVARGSGCTNVSTYTDADFTGGSFNAQAGFAEDEVAAVSFTIPASEFPIKLELAEMVFATSNATVQTTTEWSFLVWEGTPSTGTLAYVFSSDDVILPHMRIGPGTAGLNVQVSVDPGDPEQIIIQNNGSATFSIGYRIDVHNQQTANPCTTAPPSCCNAFPTTDISGLSAPGGNWLCAVDCGPFGCASGCNPFSGLGLCQPSGDWVIRASWSSFNCQPGVGACCLPDGTCDVMLVADCNAMGGLFQGDGTDCAEVTCPDPIVACCFEPPFGGCLDLTENDCILAGGTPLAPGADCMSIICFETGACCLPDGSCMDDVSPDDCATMGGTYQGADTLCADITCPDPVGACCFPTGFCLNLTEAECVNVGATWLGVGSACGVDGDGNGVNDVCETPACPGDANGDNQVNFDDLNAVLGAWGGTDAGADVDDDGDVDFDDLNQVLGAWGQSC